MADSEDDLGGFDPTTPRPPPKRKTKPRANGKQTNKNNAEPGSSSKPLARKKPANAKTRQHNEDSEEVREVLRDIELDEADEVETANVGEEDVQMVDVSNSKKTVPMLNGKTAAKEKGKAKVPASKSTTKAQADPAAIDVDAVESDDEMNEATQDIARTIAAAYGVGKKEKTSREVAKLQERLRQSQEHVQALVQKLEETLRVRETEAEKLLKAKDEQYKVELKAKEALVEALTIQLAQNDTLALRGKQSILHMITREAAEEEQRTLKANNMQLKELLAQKEQELKSKDSQITGLQQREKELQMELKAEVERSKTMALRTPQTAMRNRTGGAFEDPKNAQVIRFYEDLTNVLVTNMKYGPGPEDEWILKCIYTFSDDLANGAIQQSVAFSLRMPSPIETESTKDQSIHYVPEELDKEPPDFVEKLEFLNQPFTFSRRQLSLFSRTLYDRLKEACGIEDQLEDDEVQIVES